MKGFNIFSVNYLQLLQDSLGSIKKVLWFLARDAFLCILMLVLLAIVLGEFLLYNDIVLPEIREPDVVSNIVTFQEKDYLWVSQTLQSRESTFNNEVTSGIENPFY